MAKARCSNCLPTLGVITTTSSYHLPSLPRVRGMVINNFFAPCTTRNPLIRNPSCSTSKKAFRLPSPSNRTIRLIVIVPSVAALGRVSLAQCSLTDSCDMMGFLYNPGIADLIDLCRPTVPHRPCTFHVVFQSSPDPPGLGYPALLSSIGRTKT